MFHSITSGRHVGRNMVLAGITAGSTLVGVSAAVAGSCPSDKMKADARQPVSSRRQGRDRHGARRHRSREGAGEHQGSPAPLPQAHHRARRHRAVAQPRRSSRDHLHRRGRDRRICQQLRGSDCAQGRRDPTGDQRHCRIGGRITATRPSFCLWATSCTTRTTTTCDVASASVEPRVTPESLKRFQSGRHIASPD